MGDYSLLFAVEAAHPYFSDPGRLRLSFQPDAASAAWLEKAGCVIRAWNHRIEVHHETRRDLPRRLAAAGEAQDLRFAVHAQDPRFAQYTDGLAQMHEPPLTFWGGDARRGADGAWRMRAGQDHAHFWSDTGSRPAFVVVIPVAGEPADEPRRYRLALRSRATIWKYLLVGDWGEQASYVYDPDKAFTFVASDETLGDGRTVKALVSEKAIPLAERFPHKFELRGRQPGDDPGPVLVKRLPVPHPASLTGRRSDSALVSEIYVQSLKITLAP